MVQGSGFEVQGPGSRVQGPGTRVQGPGSRVQGPGSRVQGFEEADWGWSRGVDDGVGGEAQRRVGLRPLVNLALSHTHILSPFHIKKKRLSLTG